MEALQTIADIVCADGPCSQWAPDTIERVARALVEAGLAPPDVDDTPRLTKRLPTVLELTEREPHAHQAGSVLQSISESVYPYHEYGDATPTAHCPLWLLDLLEAAQLTYARWPDIEPNSALVTEIERFIAALSAPEHERLQNALDEQVHDATSADAAEINNAGIAAQAEYLGLTRVNLLAILDAPED